MSAGLLLFSTLGASGSRLTAALFMGIFGIGFGMVTQILMVAVQNAVEPRGIGTATAAANLFHALGGSVGVAVYGAIFTAGPRRRRARHAAARAPASRLCQANHTDDKHRSNRRPTMPVINAGDLDTGNLKGVDHGATISLILDHSEPGQGPRLHRHPYDETWVVHEGNLTFQLGEERIKAHAGDIVIAPPDVPHKFTNDGPGDSNMVCIHANPTMVTEWLE